MFTPLSGLATEPTFSSQILILPSISKGNVPQLACDLLVASLNLSHVGYLDSKHLVPVVGSREGNTKGISTPLEVFSSPTSQVTVVQQRSPVLKAYKEEFVQALLGWIRSLGLKAIVVLTGMDTTNRSDAQMHTPNYYFVPPTSPPLPTDVSKSLEELGLQSYMSPPIPSYLQVESARLKEKEGDVPFIPSGGLTRRILQSLGPNWPTPVMAILQFVFEGDNRGDAGMLVALLNRVLELKLQKIEEPESWKQGLFGSNHDGSLFG